MRVTIFGPPLSNSGGIGTLFRYLSEEVSDEVDLTFVDTRGRAKNPIFSAFALISAVNSALNLRLTKKIDLAHVNFGSRGSAYRKAILIFVLRAILRIPTVAHIHSSTFDSWMRDANPVVRKVVVHCLNSVDRVFVLGANWKSVVEELGVKPFKVRTLVMGVPKITGPQQQTWDLQTNIRILFAGEMSERKGLPFLLEAISEMPADKFHLTVVGAGDDVKWRNFARELGCSDSVTFLGLVDPKKVHQLLLESHALILPSRAEGLPVSVMEAWSASRVVMTTNVGALSEYLVDGDNSIVIESQNVENIVTALRKIENLNSAKKIARSGERTWEKYFNVAQTSQAVFSEWYQVIENR